MKKNLSILLSISIGLLFIVSAVSKIYPMEPFEYLFVDAGVASWKTAPYLARIFVGIELFLGLLLIFNIALRRFTIKFAVFLLSLFIVYLIYKIIMDGNTGNCGCFGEYIVMSPLQGIFKNCMLLVACFCLYVFTEANFKNTRFKSVFILVLFVSSMAIGFFVYSIDFKFAKSKDFSIVNYKLPLEFMYGEKQNEKPKIDLLKGKHIIAFLSLSCPHCKIAAQKIHVINNKNPAIPFYIALNGDKEKEGKFLEYTHTEDIPHHLFLGPKEWIQIAGISLPIIMYVENSVVVKKFNGLELDQTDIETWLSK